MVFVDSIIYKNIIVTTICFGKGDFLRIMIVHHDGFERYMKFFLSSVIGMNSNNRGKHNTLALSLCVLLKN